MEKRFIIKKSKINGLGCFASKLIKKGELIHILLGKTVSIPQLKKMYELGKERIDDPLQVGDLKYISLSKPGIFFNHSCNPNAGIKGRATLFALRDIKKGEEITFDYSTTEWTNDKAWKINWTKIWKIKCNCKSSKCRKYIKTFNNLPVKLKERYRQRRALPNFILRKIDKNN